MNSFSVDLTNCDREPIHVPGAIQPHGVLLALDPVDATFRHASANTGEIIGIEAEDLIGSDAADLFGSKLIDNLLSRDLSPTDEGSVVPVKARLKGSDRASGSTAFSGFVHKYNGLLFLELFDPAALSGETFASQASRNQAIRRLRKPSEIEDLCAITASSFRFLTGYDRVMVYKFLPDLHGEVVAEDTDHGERFLGLHYPASDIPAPARDLYLKNLIRIIGDVDAVPVPLMPATMAETREPLDLSYAKLRAVSPIHIQYLKNMGVRATMSVSLIVNGKLWGLVACHHYAPKVLSTDQLHFCELLAQTAAGFLERIEYSTQLAQVVRAQALSDVIEEEEEGGAAQIEKSLPDRAEQINSIVPWDCFIACFGDEKIVLGDAPDDLPDFAALSDRADGGVFMTDHLASVVDLSEEQAELLSGAAYMEIWPGGNEYVVLGRKRFPRTVYWAGKPEKPAELSEDGLLNLTPRQSFEKWAQTVEDRSAPFAEGDEETLDVIRRTLMAVRAAERTREAVLARREAERAESDLRIELLHSARMSSMGELASGLAHEINQPLTALGNYVSASKEILATSEAAIPDGVLDLMEEATKEAHRAGEIVRRLRSFIEKGEVERSAVDLSETVEAAVRLAQPSALAGQVTVEWHLARGLPEVLADRVQIEQVVFNLVRNAVEAMEGRDTRRLSIGTSTVGDSAVEAWIADTGPGLSDEALKDLFRPFVSSKRTGMGIGLSLCRSIIEAHGGRISARNNETGAEFRFSLPLIEEGGAQ